MPRKRRGFEEPRRCTVSSLVERLADELKSNRPSGQPMIEEEEFPTGKLRVNVTWDEWDLYKKERGAENKEAGNDKHAKAVEEHPPVIHPVVRTHPETGIDGLFVNYGFTDRIKGLRREESKALLDMLFVHIQKPEYQVRWHWKPNAIAFWDNRVTQHYAVNDYLPHRRIMNRATILGDRPYHRSRMPVAVKAAAE